MTDKENPVYFDIQVDDKRNVTIQDVETKRVMPVMIDTDITIRGEAGMFTRATFDVMPRKLDIKEGFAFIHHICAICKQRASTSDSINVRIYNDEQPALSVHMRFLDNKTNSFITNVFSYVIRISFSDTRMPIVLVDLELVDAPIGYEPEPISSAVCGACKRTMQETHHQQCSCEKCNERREYEAKQAREWLDELYLVQS